MPYDPNLPQENTLIDAAQMRGQLTGLKDLIDALPVITAAVVDGVSTGNPGDPASVMLGVSGGTLHFSFGIPKGQDGQAGQDGSQGPPGAPFTNFIIDGVTTLNPGDPATVNASFDGMAVRLVFGIPRGQEGQAGQQGPQGQPFGNFLVDSVTTLNPGENATVQATFDGSNVRFQFGIPRGTNGNDGGMGAQGPPGEVTNMQLNSAINGTSSNSNAVATLGLTVSDPPTVGEVQAIASKLDELILALRR